MSSVKVKFRPSTVPGLSGTVFYQVSHNRMVRQLATAYKIFPSEWDNSRHCISVSPDPYRNNILIALHDSICHDMDRFNRIISLLKHRNIGFGPDDVITAFVRLSDKLSLFNFMEARIVWLQQNGQIRTSETYRSTLNSFRRFRRNEDILLDTITPEIIESYGAYLRRCGLIPNSISFYMRILRAVYNRACSIGLVEAGCRPFAHVYTGVDKTTKRAVDLNTIRKIRDLDLSANPSADYARDIFMLSFYTRGMSFVDLAYLRKTDLCGCVLTYRRRKTGQLITVKWTHEMQDILDKYPTNETDYLVPIITSTAASPRRQYRNRHYMVNYNLKTIAKRLGLQIPLTTYVSRHAWASIAKAKGVSLGTISEGLGHDSEQTTQIYLASLDTSAVDQANDLILSSLRPARITVRLTKSGTERERKDRGKTIRHRH